MMLKVGMLMVTMFLVSGCATIFGEDSDALQARQQVEHDKQIKHDRLQAEVERLRSQIKAKKIELQGL